MSPPIQQPKTPPRQPNQQWLDTAIYVALSLLILGIFGQALHFEFISFDDQAYVYDNPHVRQGLTLDSIRWAFTAVVVGNWAPVTLLTHLAVWQFFGPESGIHHLVNVVLHAIATLLLFAVFKRATGARWPSAFVAFLFALHPLHVESVAWVAERKDVLSALFWFSGLYAYVRYVESPNRRHYLMIVAAFCLGLMSKSMLVTFPFTLLLFDLWPLRRTPVPALLWEKLPLFGVTALGSVVTYLVQGSAGAVSDLSLGLRLSNALVSYLVYIAKMFWPSGLAMFYMYPESIPMWQAASALVALVAISAAAVYSLRSYPYFFAGWFWYLGTLVPVIGLVQVGAQAYADRYTYIPMVGLFWIVAWGAVDLIKRWPQARLAVSAAAIAICVLCLPLTWAQAAYWQDSLTLYQHAMDVTSNNLLAQRNLADVHYAEANRLMNSGRGSQAMEHLAETLRLRPDFAEAHNNLGILLAKTPGRTAEAMEQFQAAVRLDPKLAQAHQNLGMLLAADPGRAAEALAQLEAAQRLQPNPQLAALIDQLRSKH